MALAEIVARKREDVAQRMRDCPLEEVRARVTPTDRSLLDALSGTRGSGFILECKKASPSAGLLRANFDPVDVARAYAPFASAISVLTDGPFFGGSFDDLRRVRDSVSQPVLCKDFVVHPYQVYEARMHGADAVLLMLSVLDDATYLQCAEAVRQLDMHALTEVHDEAEMAQAARLGACIIGVNNRDLTTLRVDLETTPRLAALRPPHALLVCESGIASHRDIVRMRPLVDAFLVGSALMREYDVDRAVRELLFGRVKVCGLTRVDDARDAWEAGATWGGMIFATESPRHLELLHARALRQWSAGLRWAGVFVNEAAERVADIAYELTLSAVQLHGDESTDEVRALRNLLPAGCELWKAVRVRDRVPPIDGADRLLLDAFSPTARGGTGQTFDWRLLEGLDDRSRIIVSGGLDPSRAAAADALGGWMLDVNSGVEDSPGCKSRARLRAFFAALRGAVDEGTEEQFP